MAAEVTAESGTVTPVLETSAAAQVDTQQADVAPPVDLSTMDLRPGADAGADMELVHPVTGVALGVTLHVISMDAPKWRKAMRAVRDSVAAAPQAEPKEEDDQNMLRLARAAACAVTGWRTGDMQTMRFNGADLPYSYDAALMVMLRLTWVVDQVTMFRDRRANFFTP